MTGENISYPVYLLINILSYFNFIYKRTSLECKMIYKAVWGQIAVYPYVLFFFFFFFFGGGGGGGEWYGQ